MFGDHGTAGAMVGTGVASPALYRLRGLIWIALRRWHLGGHLPNPAADSMASALRAAVRAVNSRASVALSPILIELAKVDDMSGALRALAQLETTHHRGLREAWTGGLREILLSPEHAVDASERRTRREEQPRPWSGGRIRPSMRLADSEDIRLPRPEVIPLRRHAPIPEQLPDEPADEFNLPVDLVLVPGFGTGAISRRRAEYQARQAIWGGNRFLLPHHIETLPSDVYGAAIRELVQGLDKSDLEDGAAVGCLACLLKALTGRTTTGIQWLCAARAGSQNDQQAIIDLDRGAIEFPPFWKVLPEQDSGATELQERAAPLGYYHPCDSDQRSLLVPVFHRVTLPLARSVHRVLGRHRANLANLATLDAMELDHAAQAAAETLSANLGLSISVAALRRSLGAQVMEVSGDSALAQLICGDSFGAPLAAQHYYAPRRADIARVYADAVCVHLPAATFSPIPQAAARVGSELLVSPQTAKAMADASATKDWDDSRDDEHAGWARRHRHMADHLARMILATTGHRPTEALFELTLHDVDLETGAALFSDKRIDAAHDPRLAVLPVIVCEQVGVYVQHLSELAVAHGTCCELVASVCSGTAPMLFDLDDDLNPQPLTMARLKARSPAPWNQLPWNWGRTYLRTRGIEMGAPANLMSCQLGHLDIVGYPYSHQSPTTPAEVVAELRPWLDRMARNQGWRVLNAAKQKQRYSEVITLPPLRDWSEQIARSEQAGKESHRQWERSLRRQARRARDHALQLVLDHPGLVAAGISQAFRKVPHAPAQPLDELALFRVRSDLVDAVGDDAPAAIAATRALRRVLAAAAKQSGVSYPTVALPVAVRRPLDNPFFRSACVAWSQMHALRAHVAERAQEKRPRRGFDLQVARTAEALALFGFVDNSDHIMAILAARAQAAPSARIVDLMLVPLPDGQVFGLRGVAALALANLAQVYPSEPLPTRAAINATLAQILPTWATRESADSGDLLTRLCSTTAVVNRYELSPAARFAMDADHGSTHAALAEQLAYIDGDTVSPIRASTEEDRHLPVDALSNRVFKRQGSDSATPRAQYRQLCRVIPPTHRDTTLPLTGQIIRARDREAASTRQSVLAELDLQLAQPNLHAIVYVLGDWIRAEAQRTQGTAKPLAYRTLETYLTRIGGALVEVIGDCPLAAWSEELLEDAYLYALDASDQAKQKVAAALLSFHRHCSSRWEFPELDLSPIYAELGAGRHNADAALILPQERDRALEAIRQMAWNQTGSDFALTRIARAADWVVYYLAWGGVRLGEALGLQARDIGVRPEGALMTKVRSNRLRPLKTLSATRALTFEPHANEPMHRSRVLQRVDDVRRHAGARRPDSAYLLYAAGIDDADKNALADPVARTIRGALAEVTGRPSERLHRLRHLAATQRMLQVVLSPSDRQAIGLDKGAEPPSKVLMPRDMQAVSTPMGHAHWGTTIAWYLHMPWVLQSRPAQRSREAYCSRRFVAGAMGRSPATIDSILRGGNGDAVAAWFDHFRRGRPQSMQVSSRPCTDTEDTPTLWTAEQIGILLDRANAAKDLESVLRSMGVPIGETPNVVRVCERWEAKLGKRLLPKRVRGKLRNCPVRALRRMEGDRPLEALWRRMDSVLGGGPYRVIAEAYFTWLRPARSISVLLPAAESDALVIELEQIGVPISQIDRAVAPGENVTLTVRSNASRNAAKCSPAMSLTRVLTVIGITLDLCPQNPGR
jgi:integrase